MRPTSQLNHSTHSLRGICGSYLSRCMSDQPNKAPGGEPGPQTPRRVPTEIEMAEGLAAEAAGELPELREEEANPAARLLLTDVDMLCNYCDESPCFKKCRHCKLTKYCCKSCQCADWRAHRGKPSLRGYLTSVQRGFVVVPYST